MGEENMDGNLNAMTAGTLALLTDTARAGNRGGSFLGGGGEGGCGSYLTAAAVADGTATKEAIDASNRQYIATMGAISAQFEESRRSDQATGICKNITDQEFRSLDRQRDIERLMLEGQKESAKCCCEIEKSIAQAAKEAAKCCYEAQLQACKDHAAITATVLADGALTRALITGTALDAANAKIIKLETIEALRDNGHHGHR